MTVWIYCHLVTMCRNDQDSFLIMVKLNKNGNELKRKKTEGKKDVQLLKSPVVHPALTSEMR